MRVIEALEIHVVHSCNLVCEGCSHYSNQGHEGLVSLDEADTWMRLWNRRVRPARFSLLGGEPTLHPQLAEFVVLSRQHWPDAQLQVVTNGFLLHRHPELPVVLANDANATISVSIHHTGASYRKKLTPVVGLLHDWVRRYGIRVEYRPSHGFWTRRYNGSGAAMQPFDDGQPRRSWENCSAKRCHQLFQGQIWKCPAVAYLQLQDAKYGLSDVWQPYLRYVPLSPHSTAEQLEAFFSEEDEACCRMCPAAPERFALPSPLVRTHRSTPLR
jgi:hypothetical protein